MALSSAFWLRIWNILWTSSKIRKVVLRKVYAETVSVFVIQLNLYKITKSIVKKLKSVQIFYPMVRKNFINWNVQKPLGSYLLLFISTPKAFSFLKSQWTDEKRKTYPLWLCILYCWAREWRNFVLQNRKRTKLFGRLKILSTSWKKQPRIFTTENKTSRWFFKISPPVSKESVNDCWMCTEAFENDQEKVLDLCHHSGRFLGWAHSQGNLKRKIDNFNPLIAHNTAGFDIYQWHVQYSTKRIQTTSSLWIPQQMKSKFISLFPSGETNLWTQQIEAKCLRKHAILDTFKFMAQSLEKLVSFVPMEKICLPRGSIQYWKNSVTDWLTEKVRRFSLHIPGHLRKILWRKTASKGVY